MLFKNAAYRELEAIVAEINNDLSNNYKDNAILGIKKLEKQIEETEQSGGLKPKDLQKFKELLVHYKADVASFKRTY